MDHISFQNRILFKRKIYKTLVPAIFINFLKSLTIEMHPQNR